jgi:hypothetical protein
MRDRVVGVAVGLVGDEEAAGLGPGAGDLGRGAQDDVVGQGLGVDGGVGAEVAWAAMRSTCQRGGDRAFVADCGRDG